LSDALRGLDLPRSRGASAKHRELRQALQLRWVPDYTTLYRFLKRLDDDGIDHGQSRVHPIEREMLVPMNTRSARLAKNLVLDGDVSRGIGACIHFVMANTLIKPVRLFWLARRGYISKFNCGFFRRGFVTTMNIG